MKTTTALILFTLSLCCAAPAQAGFNVETKLTTSDASINAMFGGAVAVSGNTAIVGAPDGSLGLDEIFDSAYLFDVTTGNQLFKLTASDATAGDLFGASVAISGNTAIVGAHANDDNGSDSGSAYLFDVTTGNQLFKLTASDTDGAHWFGWSVAISGNIAIVGAYGDDAGSRFGRAYLFDVTTGTQIAKLTASDANAGDTFGYSVAISGNRAIVGAPFKGVNAPGSAYVFDVTTGTQIAKLTVDPSATFELFGWSVGISDNIAIVGTNSFKLEHPNSAYVFDVTTGNQLAKLTASDAAADDQFGSSVAISGNTAIVGAVGDSDAGSYSGSAYLFDVATGMQLTKLTASDAAKEDSFGYSVGISGNAAIVGGYGAYLYTPEPSSLVLCGLALLFAATRRKM